jgi:hypothetical protein
MLANQVPPLAELGRYSCDFAQWAQDWSADFQLGSPPQTPSGPTGLARAEVVQNNTARDANKPGALHGRYFEAPCTAYPDKAP